MCDTIVPARPNQARHSPLASNTLTITGQRVSLPGRKEPPGHTGCHPKTTCHQPQLRANQPSAEPAGRYCGARHPGSRHHPVTSPSTPARSGPQQSLGPRAADAPAPRVCTAAPRPAHAGFPGHAGPALPLPGGLSGATPGRTGFGQPVPSVLLESSPVQGRARTERAQVSAAEAGVPSSRLDPGRVGGHVGHSAPGGSLSASGDVLVVTPGWTPEVLSMACHVRDDPPRRGVIWPECPRPGQREIMTQEEWRAGRPGGHHFDTKPPCGHLLLDQAPDAG